MSDVVASGRMALPAGAVIPSLSILQNIMAATRNPGHPDPCDRFAGLPGPVAFVQGWDVSGAFEAVVGPTRCNDHYTAIRANGSGTVTIRLRAAANGVAGGTISSAWNIRVDNVVVASHSQVSYGGLRYWGHGLQNDGLLVTDVAVEFGDLITADFELTGDLPAFFAVDDWAWGTPNGTHLMAWGDLLSGSLFRRMRGSGSV